MNLRPSGYEPDELPDCSTPRLEKPNIMPAPPKSQGFFAAVQKNRPPLRSKQLRIGRCYRSTCLPRRGAGFEPFG